MDMQAKTLVINPNKRFSVEEALAHPFFRSARKTEWEEECKKPFKLKFNEEKKMSLKERMTAILKEVSHFRPSVLKDKYVIAKLDAIKEPVREQKAKKAPPNSPITPMNNGPSTQGSVI